MNAAEFQRLAEIAVEQVKPERNGFTLMGQGADRAEYQLEIQFDMPLDSRTRTVLGELLTQSEVTVRRRPPIPLVTSPAPARRDRAHRRPGRHVTAD